MLAVYPGSPAVGTPPVRSIDTDTTEGPSGGSGGGAAGGGDANTGSPSPLAARAAVAAALTPTPRLAVIDRQESVAAFSSSRLSSWRSWGGAGGGGGGSSLAKRGSGAGKTAAELGPSYHCQVPEREGGGGRNLIRNAVWP